MPVAFTPQAVIEGEDFFYLRFHVDGCSHSPFYYVWDYNTNRPAFCGLCWLSSYFEDEFPRSLHAVVKNKKDRQFPMSPQFWAHLQAHLGLKPPEKGQKLAEYRRARERLYGKPPSPQQLPVTNALWLMMGYQPKLAQPLLKSLFGATEPDISSEFKLSLYETHRTIAKGVRLALRNIRRN